MRPWTASRRTTTAGRPPRRPSPRRRRGHPRRSRRHRRACSRRSRPRTTGSRQSPIPRSSPFAASPVQALRDIRAGRRPVNPHMWPDEVDEVIGGDLTCAVANVTPAGGAVVTAVAPIGLRNREAGTVGFTTSLGFGKKLERIQRNPRVALAYHDREHGFASGSDYVLVQGEATATLAPDRELIENEIGPRAERFMGKAKRGRIFWDRWLQEYYADRVPVTVRVERIIAWRDQHASTEP